MTRIKRALAIFSNMKLHSILARGQVFQQELPFQRNTARASLPEEFVELHMYASCLYVFDSAVDFVVVAFTFCSGCVIDRRCLRKTRH